MPTRRLPPQLTSFVGRADELAAIGSTVPAGRLLTLVGPGGCGKTRLAIRIGHDLAGAWPDGVAWVGLEQEPAAGQVADRVAEALDVLLPVGLDPVPALVGALRERALLLVVDNCEHVLDGAARVLAAILAGCPGVAVLATSRATLGVPGERVWRVPPLALGDALELFLRRAGLGAEAREPARRLCDRLDRLPLARELAVEVDAPEAARISRALTAVGRLMVGPAAALDEARAARAEALRAGDVFVADATEAFIGLVHVLADDYPQAIKHLGAAVAGRSPGGIGAWRRSRSAGWRWPRRGPAICGGRGSWRSRRSRRRRRYGTSTGPARPGACWPRSGSCRAGCRRPSGRSSRSTRCSPATCRSSPGGSGPRRCWRWPAGARRRRCSGAGGRAGGSRCRVRRAWPRRPGWCWRRRCDRRATGKPRPARCRPSKTRR